MSKENIVKVLCTITSLLIIANIIMLVSVVNVFFSQM